MRERLHEFFAVTETSVYRVRDMLDNGGTPFVEKVSQRSPSRVDVGDRLKNGSLVAVTKRGLFLYHDDLPCRGRALNRPARLEELGALLIGDHTSPVVGLFLDQREALDCLNWGPGALNERRWEKCTKAVIEAIGDDHPVFTISRHPDYAFSFS